MFQREIDVFLTLVLTLPFAQNDKTVKGCVGGNATLDFKPDILNHLDVKSFEWALPPAHEGHQLFAKFEPNKSANLTYVLMKGRTFHNPEEPATLFLRNLKVFDENEYTLFITYVNYSGQPPEYVLNLEVEDVCFDKAKEVDNCAVATCYTGENGILMIPGNLTEAVNGIKLVKVCNESAAGNYSCCNGALNECWQPKKIPRPLMRNQVPRLS